MFDASYNYYFVGIIELLREITFLNAVFALLGLLVVDCVSNGHKKLKVVWWKFVSFTVVLKNRSILKIYVC